MSKTFSPDQIQGIVPPLITPFTVDGQLDEAALRETVRFMLGQGVHGLVAGGSSGEGYTLTTAELQRITEIAAEEIDGKVPLIAGVIANSTRDAIVKSKAVEKLGISALQVTPAHYIYKSSDDAMLRHFREIADETSVPILIYNVIPWNYLSPDLLFRAMRETPGVVGVKQSAGDLKALADLMVGVRPGERIFAAVDSMLYPCIALGAHGVISILTTAVPSALIALWDAVKREDHVFARDLHERLLRLWNALYADNRVATTKFALWLQGAPTGHTLRPVSEPTGPQKIAVRDALADVLPRAQLREVADF